MNALDDDPTTFVHSKGPRTQDQHKHQWIMTIDDHSINPKGDMISLEDRVKK